MAHWKSVKYYLLAIWIGPYLLEQTGIMEGNPWALSSVFTIFLVMIWIFAEIRTAIKDYNIPVRVCPSCNHINLDQISSYCESCETNIIDVVPEKKGIATLGLYRQAYQYRRIAHFIREKSPHVDYSGLDQEQIKVELRQVYKLELDEMKRKGLPEKHLAGLLGYIESENYTHLKVD
ncbi:MAG: hypothetical protein ACXAD7_09875 [Candidatus Kariarchaeaceae archaeon]|jgi:hypothetical protein